MREYNSQFVEKDTHVLGISADGRPSLAAYNLSLGPSLSYPVPLLSDFWPHGEVIQRYGLFNDEQGTSRRAVIVVDKEGIVRFRRVYVKIDDLDINEVLAEVDKLQGR